MSDTNILVNPGGSCTIEVGTTEVVGLQGCNHGHESEVLLLGDKIITQFNPDTARCDRNSAHIDSPRDQHDEEVADTEDVLLLMNLHKPALDKSASFLYSRHDDSATVIQGEECIQTKNVVYRLDAENPPDIEMKSQLGDPINDSTETIHNHELSLAERDSTNMCEDLQLDTLVTVMEDLKQIKDQLSCIHSYNDDDDDDDDDNMEINISFMKIDDKDMISNCNIREANINATKERSANCKGRYGRKISLEGSDHAHSRECHINPMLEVCSQTKKCIDVERTDECDTDDLDDAGGSSRDEENGTTNIDSLVEKWDIKNDNCKTADATLIFNSGIEVGEGEVNIVCKNVTEGEICDSVFTGISSLKNDISDVDGESETLTESVMCQDIEWNTDSCEKRVETPGDSCGSIVQSRVMQQEEFETTSLLDRDEDSGLNQLFMEDARWAACNKPLTSRSAQKRKLQRQKLQRQMARFKPSRSTSRKYALSFHELSQPLCTNVTEDIDVSLTCPVCLDLYHRPTKCHPCGHMFCDPCLRHMTHQGSEGVLCPLCRTVINTCELDTELNEQLMFQHFDVYSCRARTERNNKHRFNRLPYTPPVPLGRKFLRKLAASRLYQSETRWMSHDWVKFLLGCMAGVFVTMMLMMFNKVRTISDARDVNIMFLSMLTGVGATFVIFKIVRI